MLACIGVPLYNVIVQLMIFYGIVVSSLSPCSHTFVSLASRKLISSDLIIDVLNFIQDIDSVCIDL